MSAVDRFGRISTSRKSSLISCSIVHPGLHWTASSQSIRRQAASVAVASSRSEPGAPAAVPRRPARNIRDRADEDRPFPLESRDADSPSPFRAVVGDHAEGRVREAPRTPEGRRGGRSAARGRDRAAAAANQAGALLHHGKADPGEAGHQLLQLLRVRHRQGGPAALCPEDAEDAAVDGSGRRGGEAGAHVRHRRAPQARPARGPGVPAALRGSVVGGRAVGRLSARRVDQARRAHRHRQVRRVRDAGRPEADARSGCAGHRLAVHGRPADGRGECIRSRC